MTSFLNAKLSRLSVRSRIFYLSGFLLLLIAINGGTGFWTIQHSGEQLRQVQERQMPAISRFTTLMLMQTKEAAAFGAARRAGATIGQLPGSEDSFESATLEFETLAEIISSVLIVAELQFRRLADQSDNEEQKRVYASLRQRTGEIHVRHEVYVKRATEKLQALKEGRLLEATSLDEQVKELQEAIAQDVAHTQREMKMLLQSTISSTRKQAVDGLTVMMATALFGVAMGMAMSLTIAGSITGPLLRAVKTVQAMTAGKTDAALVPESDDEIGVLCSAVADYRQRTLDANRAANDAADVANRYRVNAERALEATRSQEALLSSMAEVAQVGGWELDLRSMRLLWSSQTKAIHEVDADYEPNVEEAIKFYRPDSQAIIRSAVELGAKTGERWDLELPIITAKGREIWIRAVGEPLMQDGIPTKLVGAIQNVTDQRAEREELAAHRDRLQELVDAATADLKTKAEKLQQALAKEKELSEMQRQFVATASHEFRTPLAIIDSTVQRLVRKKDRLSSEELEERARTVRESVATMTNLMETTLDAARMDAGQIKIVATDVDLEELLSAVCDRHRELNKDAHIRVEFDSLPKTLKADRGALAHVFENLVSNAVKYSADTTEVTVLAKCEGDEVLVEVRDRGIGIDEEDLPQMFERFFRAKSAIGVSGTGIGLNLAKALLELHGGSISVQSQRGVGSSFIVRLPIQGVWPACVGETKGNIAA